MIFNSLNQIKIVLPFIFCSIIFAIIYNFFRILFTLNLGKKLKKIIFDCIFYSFLAIFFNFLLNFYNFGIFSLFLFLIFIFIFLSVSKLLNKSVVFLEKKWYNTINTFFIGGRKKNEKSKRN